MWKSPIVTLCVGGETFKTRLETIRSKGGLLASVFDGDWRSRLDADGQIFLDRDGAVFHALLNYLRDGTAIPLPTDAYLLERILHEAKYFGLKEFAAFIEKKLAYETLPIKHKRSTSRTRKSTKTLQIREELKKEINREKQLVAEKSLPPSIQAPLPPFSAVNLRPSFQPERPETPLRKTDAEKDAKTSESSKKAISISLPRNFAHVAHVGWTGNGKILKEHRVARDDATVQAIIAAAHQADLTPVYNMVNGQDEVYGSQAVEVILSGPLMKTRDQKDVPITETALYTQPIKPSPKSSK